MSRKLPLLLTALSLVLVPACDDKDEKKTDDKKAEGDAKTDDKKTEGDAKTEAKADGEAAADGGEEKKAEGGW